jgi:hypothetical protein
MANVIVIPLTPLVDVGPELVTPFQRRADIPRSADGTYESFRAMLAPRPKVAQLEQHAPGPCVRLEKDT